MIKIKFYALISKNIAFWPLPFPPLLENENHDRIYAPRHLVARLEGLSPTAPARLYQIGKTVKNAKYYFWPRIVYD